MSNKFTLGHTAPVKDARGRSINLGDFVAYTTNAEGGGLNFGHVEAIYENKWIHPHDGTTQYNHKLVMMKTDPFGQPKYDFDWDDVTHQRVPTTRQLKSGRVDHYEYKFLLA